MEVIDFKAFVNNTYRETGITQKETYFFDSFLTLGKFLLFLFLAAKLAPMVFIGIDMSISDAYLGL